MDKRNTVRFGLDDGRYAMVGLDVSPVRDSGAVYGSGEIVVSGDNFGSGPVIVEGLGLFRAGG